MIQRCTPRMLLLLPKQKVGEYFQTLLESIAIPESSPTEAEAAWAAMKAKRRQDTLQSAHNLGGRASRTYDEGLKLLLTAINAGKAARALRAEAEAKVTPLEREHDSGVITQCAFCIK